MRDGKKLLRISVALFAIAFLFWLYTNQLSKNPPGFYVDECGIAYNAYLLAHTGAGQFGGRFPLFFQFYTNDWTQWANPTQIYLLAIPFRLAGPGILLARVFSAFWVFSACLLLGLLAQRVSGNKIVGIITGAIAVCTPWLFEISRLVFETYFYPMAIVLLLLAVHRAQQKHKWGASDIAFVAVTLALLTYSYTIGRLLGPLMAIGLLLFVSTPKQWLNVLKTWLVYAATLIPLLVFRFRHPGTLTQRFYTVSYITPDMPWRHIASHFVRRYLEDLSLISLLIDGDPNSRHHVPNSLGSFLAGAFILAIIGLMIVIVRRWRDPWWRFIVFGGLVSVVPGALTMDQFHSLRMIAYPVFLLMLMIPALEFLLDRNRPEGRGSSTSWAHLSTHVRRIILGGLLLATALQALYFQTVFRRDGPERGPAFDVDYKDIYDVAMAQPQKPIYLIDGEYGPVDACGYWYATLEGRSSSELIHLSLGKRAPAGTIVISSEEYCVNCEIIARQGFYLAYRQY